MATAMTVLAMMLPGVTAPAEAQVVVVDKQECHTQKCERRVWLKQHRKQQHIRAVKCNKGIVVSCIDRGAARWRVNKFVMRRRAWCESKYDPSAKNGKYMGVFQFGWTLWSITPYAGHSPYHPKWASLAAAWAEAHGYSSHWSCR